jgi:hypothetical protein
MKNPLLRVKSSTNTSRTKKDNIRNTKIVSKKIILRRKAMLEIIQTTITRTIPIRAILTLTTKTKIDFVKGKIFSM